MKTLLEQVINELRLSKVSTGRKLDTKNFEDLEKGDLIYIYLVDNDRLNLEEVDVIKKGDKKFWSCRIGTVKNYKNVQSIKNYEKVTDDDGGKQSIGRTDIPLFLVERFGEPCFIYSTSLELINTLLNDKAALDAEMTNGNVIHY